MRDDVEVAAGVDGEIPRLGNALDDPYELERPEVERLPAVVAAVGDVEAATWADGDAARRVEHAGVAAGTAHARERRSLGLAGTDAEDAVAERVCQVHVARLVDGDPGRPRERGGGVERRSQRLGTTGHGCEPDHAVRDDDAVEQQPQLRVAEVELDVAGRVAHVSIPIQVTYQSSSLPSRSRNEALKTSGGLRAAPAAPRGNNTR